MQSNTPCKVKQSHLGVHPKEQNISVTVNHVSKTITFQTPKLINQVVFNDYDEWGAVSIMGDLYDWHLIHDESLIVCVYGLSANEHGALQCNTECEAVFIPNEIGLNPCV